MIYDKGDLLEVIGRSYWHEFSIGEIIKVINKSEGLCKSVYTGETQYMKNQDVKLYTPNIDRLRLEIGEPIRLPETRQEKIARLEKELEEAKSEVLKIKGYDVEILTKQGDCEVDVIKIGCAKLMPKLYNEISGINIYMDRSGAHNRQIKSITFDSGVELSIKELKQIYEFYQEQKPKL